MVIIHTKEELIDFCNENGIAWKIKKDNMHGDNIFFYDVKALVKKNYDKDLGDLVCDDLCFDFTFLPGIFENEN